jgi:predicted ArsR family transcriptional regulator
MASITELEEGWMLVEAHCPICAAATRCQGFCANELKLFQTLLGDEIQIRRTEYLLEDGQRCAYLICPAQAA